MFVIRSTINLTMAHNIKFKEWRKFTRDERKSIVDRYGRSSLTSIAPTLRIYNMDIEEIPNWTDIQSDYTDDVMAQDRDSPESLSSAIKGAKFDSLSSLTLYRNRFLRLKDDYPQDEKMMLESILKHHEDRLEEKYSTNFIKYRRSNCTKGRVFERTFKNDRGTYSKYSGQDVTYTFDEPVHCYQSNFKYIRDHVNKTINRRLVDGNLYLITMTRSFAESDTGNNVDSELYRNFKPDH